MLNKEEKNNYIFIALGPLLAVLCYYSLPDSYTSLHGEAQALTPAMRAAVAMLVWMAVWWLSEAVHISVTALLPLAMFPVLGIADIQATTKPYASHFIFLFAGGFIIALAMQRWRLDRRIALGILLALGTHPARMIAGFMFITALLSAFISNTATTAMILPIALSVLNLREDSRASPATIRFGVCLMLSIAYAASIGGMTTIIGTAPNAFAAGFLSDINNGITLSFLDWFVIAAPVAIVLLILGWLLLTQVLFRFGPSFNHQFSYQQLQTAYRELGPIQREEWLVLSVFITTAVAWITRPQLNALSFVLAEQTYQPLMHLNDANIAILAAITLFVLPGRTKPLMNWDYAVRLPWGILLLLGGSFSLAAALRSNGIDSLLASQLSPYLTISYWLIILLFIGVVVFLTEITSNTATTAALVPLFASLSPNLDVQVALIVIPVALAASCAFMMPVATPPNAIVFSSGYLRIKDMARAGLWMNLLAMAVLLVFVLSYLPTQLSP